MLPYLEVFGYAPGKTLYGAVPLANTNTDTTTPLSPAESNALRQVATDKLQNIGASERARRDAAGQALTALTVAYTLWAALVADDGGTLGHVVRGGVGLPLFFALGLKLSAEEGL